MNVTMKGRASVTVAPVARTALTTNCSGDLNFKFDAVAAMNSGDVMIVRTTSRRSSTSRANRIWNSPGSP